MLPRLLLVILLLSAMGLAQQKAVPLTTIAEEVANSDASVRASVGERKITHPGVSPADRNFTQANAVVEVVGDAVNGTVRVTFKSFEVLKANTMLSFHIITQPYSTVVPLGNYRVTSDGRPEDGFAYFIDLWNGSFVHGWPSGPLTFGVFIVSPTAGEKMQYASASVRVRQCCTLDGPVERVEVSPDGKVVNVTGTFAEDTVAAIGDQKATISGSSSLQRISLAEKNFGAGQLVLTVCSGGECSSRVIYVN